MALALLKKRPQHQMLHSGKAWLSRNIPSDVANISIEAVFESNSTVCLFTLPIAVWDMVRSNEAFDFVAYVKSHNILNDSVRGLRPANPPPDVLEAHARNVVHRHRSNK